MPLLIGLFILLVLAVEAFHWTTDKLNAIGLGWRGAGVIAAAALVLLAAARFFGRSRQNQSRTADTKGGAERVRVGRRQAAPRASQTPPYQAIPIHRRLFLRHLGADSQVMDDIVEVHHARRSRADAPIQVLQAWVHSQGKWVLVERDAILAAGDPDTSEPIPDLDAYLLGRPASPPYRPPAYLQSLATGRELRALPEVARGELVVLRTGLRHPVWIRYASAKGETTERAVTVLQVLGPAPDAAITHIRAICRERNALRTFLAGNVQMAADPETGEVIDNLGALLLTKGQPPAEPTTVPRKKGSRTRKGADATTETTPKPRGRPKKTRPGPEPRSE